MEPKLELHLHSDLVFYLQVSLGVLENENDSKEIEDILEYAHGFVANGDTEDPTLTLSGGDLLTLERELNGLEDRCNSGTPQSQLLGLMPCLEDFPTFDNFLGACISQDTIYTSYSIDENTKFMQFQTIWQENLQENSALSIFLDHANQLFISVFLNRQRVHTSSQQNGCFIFLCYVKTC